jgi:hypothetical protein
MEVGLMYQVVVLLQVAALVGLLLVDNVKQQLFVIFLLLLHLAM